MGEPGGYWEPKLSHDGKRVALAVGQDACRHLDPRPSRATCKRASASVSADDRTPLWSPDDRNIAYNSAQTGIGGIYLRPVSGQEPAKVIYEAKTQIALSTWSSDGRHLFFNRLEPNENGYDVWALDMESLKAEAVLAGPSDQSDASLSPDGRYLAFSSDESGQPQIYVQSYPTAAGRWMVSGDMTAGRAAHPLWRQDGHELFYVRGNALEAVPVETDNGFTFGTPQYLFSMNLSSVNASYDPSADGQHILTNEMPATDRDQVGARLIQNWTGILVR